MAERTSHPTELLEAYSLQMLTPETAASVRAHLQSCALCQQRLREVEDVLGLLAYAAPAVPPPAGAEERFMARVAALRANGHAPIPMTPGVSASSRRARQASRRRALWLTAASLVAVILLLVTFWTRETVTPPSPVVQAEQQARALLGAPNATIFHLQATAHGPSNALAVMAMDPSSKRGVVVTRNLPALKAGQTYEFWIVHTPAGSAGVATTPTGTFNSAADGSGSLRFTTPDNLGAVDDAGVSVEPTGGVATPDAPMLLTLASH